MTGFLKQRPNVHKHDSATYCSWLNQTEMCFPKRQRDLMARGIVTPKADARRKILRYMYHQNPSDNH